MVVQSFPSPEPSPAVRWIAWMVWGLVVLASLALFVLDLIADYADIVVPCAGTFGEGGDCNFLAISPAEVPVLAAWGWTTQTYAALMLFPPIILLLVYWTLAGLVLWRLERTWLGLIVSLALIVLPIAIVSGDGDWHKWSGLAPTLVVLSGVTANIVNTILVSFFYLVPNGRFSPKWAYIPMIFTILLIATSNLHFEGGITFSPGILSLLNMTLFGLVLLAVGLQIHRYVGASTNLQRQQMRWILLGILSFAMAILLWVLIFGRVLSIESGQARLLANLVGWFFTLSILLILPTTITVAILRYKLWNIDVIINRTLVYGSLTALVVLFYSLTVVGSSRLFQNVGGLPSSLLATALIAIMFQPARERLQRAVNRLMFGQRDEPYAVLSTLGQQLQTTAVPSETLSSIVQTIASTLKLPYAAIELTDQDAQVGGAAVGEPVGETIALPLRYQTERVGRLLVSPRTQRATFTPREQQLLADIAAQTGPVASATRLTLALQRSRERLVLAREEERRRIRRDLHDGLGPTLASQTLKLDTILEQLSGEQPAVVEQLETLKAQTQQMVADIRHLVYDLRPPALDELGLLEALRAHVAQMNEATKRVRIVVEATPEPLPVLPAAIEVAAYRIALEGVTNVLRHSKASTCLIRFVFTDDPQGSSLVLTLTDDGVGLPDELRSGVGLTSMKERAGELGGSCEVGVNPSGGTRITAVLPFSKRGEP